MLETPNALVGPGDVSRFFTGSPTDKAVWMMLGGVVLTVVGLVGTLRGAKI